MFEFLFKYPASVFSRGTFVLLGSWPRWLLFAGIAAAAFFFIFLLLRRRAAPAGWSTARSLVLAGLQWATVAVLLLLLWEPAISVTTLKPQQNIVAVVVDDSRSMSLAATGSATRQAQALDLLNSKLVRDLSNKFQVRLYRLGAGVSRIPDL